MYMCAVWRNELGNYWWLGFQSTNIAMEALYRKCILRSQQRKIIHVILLTNIEKIDLLFFSMGNTHIAENKVRGGNALKVLYSSVQENLI